MLATIEKNAPMASAPMKFLADGSVDWGNMWDSFCVLAQEGGPPHRGTMLEAQETADPHSNTYLFATQEIIQGIQAVSGLTAVSADTGWIAVQCHSPGMACWLSEAIVQENVQTRWKEAVLFVPVGDDFTLKGEIKNVITAVAKTTHYWQEHLPIEVKQTLAIQNQLTSLITRFRELLSI